MVHTYALSVKVSTENSQDILKFLAKNNFCIFRFDSFSKNLIPVDPNPSIAENDKLDPRWFHFQCIYNGVQAPPQTVFWRLSSDSAVIGFTLRVDN